MPKVLTDEQQKAVRLAAEAARRQFRDEAALLRARADKLIDLSFQDDWEILRSGETIKIVDATAPACDRKERFSFTFRATEEQPDAFKVHTGQWERRDYIENLAPVILHYIGHGKL